MAFIIFRRRDPELCSRHGSSLQNRRYFFAFFMRKKASTTERARARDTRTRWGKALHARCVIRSPEKRGLKGMLFQSFLSPLSVFHSLKETSYCLFTGCLVKNCSRCNDGSVRITYRRLPANRNFTICKPCNQTEKRRMKAKMQVIDRDESKCPPGQRLGKILFFCYEI